MTQKWFYLMIGITLLISSCHSETKKEGATTSSGIPVVISAVKKTAVANQVSISGNVEGNRTVKLGFMVAGKIDYIEKAEGRWFAKNELIASLDPSSYSIAKEMSDVQVAQVEDEYTRLKGMHDQQSISESDFAKISFGLQQAKAQQKLQAKNLADTKLYAPFSGVLLKKLGEVGEITGVGIPQFVFSDISKVKISAFIPEDELPMIQLGQEAQVLITALNETFQGKVTEVGSVADPTSRSFNLKIEVNNPKLCILPGMIAEVTISCGNTRDVLLVPASALLQDTNNQSYVFVADKSQNKAFKRIVSIASVKEGNIEITTGLHENEPVVIEGCHKLVDGASIILQNNQP
jgi:membrane fusion protein, multidrug efflux system